jgi:hypothetical protein
MMLSMIVKLERTDAMNSAQSARVFVVKISIMMECIKHMHIEIKRIVFLSLTKFLKKFKSFKMAKKENIN